MWLKSQVEENASIQDNKRNVHVFYIPFAALLHHTVPWIEIFSQQLANAYQMLKPAQER